MAVKVLNAILVVI